MRARARYGLLPRGNASRATALFSVLPSRRSPPVFARTVYFASPTFAIAEIADCSQPKSWSCVRPYREIGRVFDLRKRLLVCSTVVVWSTVERDWSCVRPWLWVRPWKKIGRVFDLRKRLVVCSTVVVWSTLERVWSCVRSWKERVWSCVRSTS